ncbi:MAG: hypothetical protein KatS3mg027_1488 [Bacteroidia bacterium]|nr:MAG: hypothetical protein KatS3mg027_1488 [Bacteroidia bacterium]
MKIVQKDNWWILIFICIWFYGQNDSVKIHLPKHYFNTILLFDYYQKPKVELPSVDFVHQKLKSYRIQQATFALGIPVWTKDVIKSDSSWTNFNLVINGLFFIL